MSDLSGLKELVERAESLEGDIKKLEDEKSRLSQECLTLRAKLTHDKSWIDTSKQRIDDIEKKHLERKDELNAEITSIESTKLLLESDVKLVKQRINDTEIEYGNIKRGLDKTLSDLNNKIESANAMLDHLVSKSDDENKKVIDLTDQKLLLEQSISELESKSIKTAKASQESLDAAKIEQLKAREQLSSIKKEIKIHSDKLDKVNSELIDARQDLSKSKSECSAFKKYEELAKVALETRETVLLKNEKQLKEAIALARRRDGVLEKIGQ